MWNGTGVCRDFWIVIYMKIIRKNGDSPSDMDFNCSVTYHL